MDRITLPNGITIESFSNKDASTEIYTEANSILENFSEEALIAAVLSLESVEDIEFSSEAKLTKDEKIILKRKMKAAPKNNDPKELLKAGGKGAAAGGVGTGIGMLLANGINKATGYQKAYGKGGRLSRKGSLKLALGLTAAAGVASALTKRNEAARQVKREYLEEIGVKKPKKDK